MYLEKIEKFLSQSKNENVTVDIAELFIQRICDYFTSIIFCQNRIMIMSMFDSDPDMEKYKESEEIHRELAYEAVENLNELFCSQGFDPFFSGDIDDPKELQTLSRDLCFEFFRKKNDLESI